LVYFTHYLGLIFNSNDQKIFEGELKKGNRIGKGKRTKKIVKWWLNHNIFFILWSQVLNFTKAVKYHMKASSDKIIGMESVKNNEREKKNIYVIYDFQANNSMKMENWSLKESSKTARAGMEKVIIRIDW